MPALNAEVMSTCMSTVSCAAVKTESMNRDALTITALTPCFAEKDTIDMRCHYITAPGVGRVLIPGCMSVAHSNDKSDCVCPKPVRPPKESDKEKIARLEDRIKQLEILVSELSTNR